MGEGEDFAGFVPFAGDLEVVADDVVLVGIEGTPEDAGHDGGGDGGGGEGDDGDEPEPIYAGAGFEPGERHQRLPTPLFFPFVFLEYVGEEEDCAGDGHREGGGLVEQAEEAHAQGEEAEDSQA